MRSRPTLCDVNTIMNKRKGFPPIADERATVLVLGTMPGEESLRKKEYYANPRNNFWKIIGVLFELGDKATYEEKTKTLIKNKIALWDVIQACERPGSLDSAINDSTIAENDFVTFYRNHPNIRYVFFNGVKAEKEYKKRVLPMLTGNTKEIRYSRLPSTSPAMARLSFAEKLLDWSQIRRNT